MRINRGLWWVVALAAVAVTALVLTMPGGTLAESHAQKEAPEMKSNHFKCYDILDWTEFEPRRVELKDQFGSSVAKVLEPRQLCNPVDKNGEGVPHPEYHLVCYQIQDDPTGNTPRVKEVMVRNQFQKGPLWVGSSNLLCVPSQKKYEPRGY